MPTWLFPMTPRSPVGADEGRLQEENLEMVGASLGGFRIHPGRLTWNLKMMVWKIIFLSKWVICRFQPLIFQGVPIKPLGVEEEFVDVLGWDFWADSIESEVMLVGTTPPTSQLGFRDFGLPPDYFLRKSVFESMVPRCSTYRLLTYMKGEKWPRSRGNWLGKYSRPMEYWECFDITFF